MFANIYLNELDQFVKHDLKVKYYARYTDDFVIVAETREYLEALLTPIIVFLRDRLLLELHPSKVEIRKAIQGIDFLGYVALPHHRVLRAKTRKRIFKKLNDKVRQYKSNRISKKTLDASLQSYLGVLSHANTYKLKQELLNKFWIWLTE